jgi:hypothetical protein
MGGYFGLKHEIPYCINGAKRKRIDTNVPRGTFVETSAIQDVSEV